MILFDQQSVKQPTHHITLIQSSNTFNKGFGGRHIVVSLLGENKACRCGFTSLKAIPPLTLIMGLMEKKELVCRLEMRTPNGQAS